MAKLEFAFGLAPAKAIEWLEKKGVTDKNYREMTASEIAKKGISKVMEISTTSKQPAQSCIVCGKRPGRCSLSSSWKKLSSFTSGNGR